MGFNEGETRASAAAAARSATHARAMSPLITPSMTEADQAGSLAASKLASESVAASTCRRGERAAGGRRQAAPRARRLAPHETARAPS